MYHYQYVTKKELAPVKNELIDLIHRVQNDLREQYFTFQYEFVGSVKRNMVTFDPRTNIGFDFDVNLAVNDDDENYSAEEIKHILMTAFNRYVHGYWYNCCEDSTRVFTIKVTDRQQSRIKHSCDFAIIYDYIDDHGKQRQEYIRSVKKSDGTIQYLWNEQPDGFYLLPAKVDFCKENGLWNNVLELYLVKKNCYGPAKKSREVFAETVNQLCQKNGFYGY